MATQTHGRAQSCSAAVRCVGARVGVWRYRQAWVGGAEEPLMQYPALVTRNCVTSITELWPLLLQFQGDCELRCMKEPM